MNILRKLVVPLVVCICACSNSNTKLVRRYKNVDYGVNSNSGIVVVEYYDKIYDPYSGNYTIKEHKSWNIEDNKITIWYSPQFDYTIKNYFFEFKDFYRLVVYQ